ncbi:hypothetical protein D3C87_1192920 [compost metagenome]
MLHGRGADAEGAAGRIERPVGLEADGHVIRAGQQAVAVILQGHGGRIHEAEREAARLQAVVRPQSRDGQHGRRGRYAAVVAWFHIGFHGRGQCRLDQQVQGRDLAALAEGKLRVLVDTRVAGRGKAQAAVLQQHVRDGAAGLDAVGAIGKAQLGQRQHDHLRGPHGLEDDAVAGAEGPRQAGALEGDAALDAHGDGVGGRDGGPRADAAGQHVAIDDGAACGRAGQHGLHVDGRFAAIVADVHAVGVVPGRAVDALLGHFFQQGHFQVAGGLGGAAGGRGGGQHDLRRGRLRGIVRPAAGAQGQRQRGARQLPAPQAGHGQYARQQQPWRGRQGDGGRLRDARLKLDEGDRVEDGKRLGAGAARAQVIEGDGKARERGAGDDAADQRQRVEVAAGGNGGIRLHHQHVPAW